MGSKVVVQRTVGSPGIDAAVVREWLHGREAGVHHWEMLCNAWRHGTWRCCEELQDRGRSHRIWEMKRGKEASSKYDPQTARFITSNLQSADHKTRRYVLPNSPLTLSLHRRRQSTWSIGQVKAVNQIRLLEKVWESRWFESGGGQKMAVYLGKGRRIDGQTNEHRSTELDTKTKNLQLQNCKVSPAPASSWVEFCCFVRPSFLGLYSSSRVENTVIFCPSCALPLSM